MSLLNFEKPKKIRSTEEHNDMFSSDSGIPGTYVPNMSDDDMYKWKAKHIKGEDERVEIRKTIHGVQVLIIVYKEIKQVKYEYNNITEWHKRHENVCISMNGKLQMSWEVYDEFVRAIAEAKECFN